MRWMRDSHLKLNGDKTELLLLGNTASPDLASMWPACMGPMPTPKAEIKSLGVWFDAELGYKPERWLPHVSVC